MKEEVLHWIEQHETRKRVAFWAILAGGMVASAIAAISIVVLIVGGLFLAVTAVGSIITGKYLFRMAADWRRQHLGNAEGRQ